MDGQTRLKRKRNSHETIDTSLRACFVLFSSMRNLGNNARWELCLKGK